MKREIQNKLIAWKTSTSRKPLILKGARQVGKTYVLNEFGLTVYNNVAYFNFENTRALHELFANTLQPLEIIKTLSIYSGIEIKPATTLIIFDEIQECGAALNSLKYFNELANEYHICAAGSLLGITLAKGFPVGKVDFLSLYPLSFNEFLWASDQEQLAKYLEEITEIKPLPEIIHEKLAQLFREYLYIGGMPRVILTYLETGDLNQARLVQNNILEAYRLDFAKHAPTNTIMRLNQVWSVIPSQLAKENKKFIYSTIRKGARAQDFENAIQWLLEAGLIHKVYHLNAPTLPLNAYIDYEIFKIYTTDVGLLGAMANLPLQVVLKSNDVLQEFKGAIAENYVAKVLAKHGQGLFYWTSGGAAELDFIIQDAQYIYPIEVKSGQSTKKKSLLTYMQKYQPRIAIRVSAMNLRLDGDIFNCPLYLFENIFRLLSII